MPEMMRRNATPRPMLNPTMAFELRLARGLCAALCEIWGAEGRGRADDGEFRRSDVVVCVKSDSAALVDVDG
jgi:hypothetical protein